MFSSRSFIVSVFTSRSLIHFEFTFVCSVSEYYNFILVYVAVQFSQHHLLKRLFFFSIVFSCLLCYRLIDHRCMGLFLGSLSCPIDLGASQVALVIKNLPTNAGNTWDLGLIPGSGRSLGGKWSPTPVFLPGESHGQRSLVGYRPYDRKVLDMTKVT